METNETLNETAESSTADTMLSSSTISTDPGDLVAQETSSPAGDEKTEEKGATEVKTEEAKAEESKPTEEVKTEAKEEDKGKGPIPYERFQEVVSEKNALKNQTAQMTKALENLAREVSELKARRETPEVPVDQEIEELFEVGKTAEALKLIKESAKREAKQEIKGELSEQSNYTTLSTALKSFQEANPDFMEMWNNGELQEIADKEPLFNTPVAAYLYRSTEKKIEALKSSLAAETAKAVEAARKEEREAAEKRIKEVEANFKAKKSTTVVTERASSPSVDSKSDLNTGGNKVSWMVNRAKQREAQGR